MSGIGVLIVHHDGEGRRSARSVVTAAPGFEAVGEAASAEEALELAMALRPRLALVAVAMPGIDGFETSRRLVTALPETTVVVLHTTVEPSATVLARSGAAAAVRVEALTPVTLQALWTEHESR